MKVDRFRSWRQGGRPAPHDAEPLRPDPAQEEFDRSARNPDGPIQTGGEDRLGRGGFARAVAEDVRHAPRRDGFVIAITGAWGEGKTSVVNLLIEDLQAEVDVVHFNPWLFSGTDQLVEHFFDELSAQLREIGGQRLQRVSKAMAAYGRTVAPLSVLPWVGEIARTSSEIASRAGQALESDAPSARARARDLRDRLKHLDRRVLVVVDDLDRLGAGEIIDVMRLVRLVGDFPNLVYLLAFDRPRVESALGHSDRDEGREYLEKIVQVVHRLPTVGRDQVYALLLNEIDQTVGDLSRFQFSQEHFTNLFVAGIRDLVTTVRDVRRYTNVLPASLALIGDEIELSDVLALEAVRVFLPESFDRLVEAKEALTTTRDLGLGSEYNRPQNEAQVKAIIDAAGPWKDQTETLIKRLFPAAERYLGGSTYGSDWLAAWERERRVAHPDVLSIYLRGRLPDGELAAREVAAVVSNLEDDAGLDALLEPLTPEQLERLLIRLRAYEADYPKNHPDIALSVVGSLKARRWSSQTTPTPPRRPYGDSKQKTSATARRTASEALRTRSGAFSNRRGDTPVACPLPGRLTTHPESQGAPYMG